MSQNIKEIARKFYEEVVSKNEFEQVKNYVSENFVVKNGTEEIPLGIDGMMNHIKATKKTYPNYTMKIIRQFSDGDYVISEFIMTGTHEGEWLGIKPTHKKLSISGINIDKISDGKIVEHGGAANTFETFWENNLIKPV